MMVLRESCERKTQGSRGDRPDVQSQPPRLHHYEGLNSLPVRAAVRRLFTDTGGASAVLAAGDVAIIVTSQRTQYTTRAQFAAAGCELTAADVAVVKIGYLEPELAQAAGGWVMALSPGVVDQDLPRLPFTRLPTPLVPFSPATFSPDLTVQLRQS